MAKDQEKVSLVTGMAYLDKVSFLCLHACVGWQACKPHTLGILFNPIVDSILIHIIIMGVYLLSNNPNKLSSQVSFNFVISKIWQFSPKTLAKLAEINCKKLI